MESGAEGSRTGYRDAGTSMPDGCPEACTGWLENGGELLETGLLTNHVSRVFSALVPYLREPAVSRQKGASI